MTTTIADETLRQLGGSNRLKAMIGLSGFYSADKGRTLALKFSNKTGANNARITLAADDTYTIELIRVRGSTFKTTSKADGVDVGNLRRVLEEGTGLAWAL